MGQFGYTASQTGHCAGWAEESGIRRERGDGLGSDFYGWGMCRIEDQWTHTISFWYKTTDWKFGYQTARKTIKRPKYHLEMSSFKLFNPRQEKSDISSENNHIKLKIKKLSVYTVHLVKHLLHLMQMHAHLRISSCNLYFL